MQDAILFFGKHYLLLMLPCAQCAKNTILDQKLNPSSEFFPNFQISSFFNIFQFSKGKFVFLTHCVKPVNGVELGHESFILITFYRKKASVVLRLSLL